MAINQGYFVVITSIHYSLYDIYSFVRTLRQREIYNERGFWNMCLIRTYFSAEHIRLVTLLQIMYFPKNTIIRTFDLIISNKTAGTFKNLIELEYIYVLWGKM